MIRKNGKILLTTRPEGKPPWGLEFPGGKLEKNETLAQGLQRELTEELGIKALVLDPIYMTAASHLDLWFLRVILPEGEEIKCCENQQHFWVDPRDQQAVKELFEKIPLLPNDEKFWHFLCC